MTFFTAILKVASLKQDLYRGHQLYISVFMAYTYIIVKSQVSLSPSNVLPGSLGPGGPSETGFHTGQLSISHAP